MGPYGEERWSHGWTPSDLGEEKEIRIGIYKENREYYAEMRIEYPPLVEAKQKADEMAKEQAEKEATESILVNF